MLFRKHILSTRTLLQAAVATLFAASAVGTAFAANPPVAPLLIPYTMQTVAGSPQFTPPGYTSVAVGYFGEGVPATTSLTNQSGAAVLNGSYSIAVDSVGNIYIVDTGNFIIREVNAQTGLITTVAGVVPKGCSGASCTVRQSGCADGVPALGAPIGSKIQGIAVDGYDNVFFADNTTTSVSVIYRGGTQIANFIKLVNPGGVAASGGIVQPGYVYHVAGAVNLTNCGPSRGSNVDNGIAFTNTASGATPTAELAAPSQSFFISLDSADNLYIADTGNSTTRVVNTQATPQTFFQYTVQPGYMRSITDCNATLTIACPTGLVTATANNGINGPANGILQSSQFKVSSADAYGNTYQLSGTGGGIGGAGYFASAEYAGGPLLTHLLQAESPVYSPLYGPVLNAQGLPTYGNAYIDLGNPALGAVSGGSILDELVTSDDQNWFLRPVYFFSDDIGSFWYMDSNKVAVSRVDPYTSLETENLLSKRSQAAISGLFQNSPASYNNPWYCVYGTSQAPWTQGPKTYDPQGDGCPIEVATWSGGNDSTSDGLGNIYVDDSGEQLVRQLQIGNVFPATAVGTSTPVTQPIQVHFNSNNPPVTGSTIPDAGATGVGVTTTSFSMAPGIPDFTINSTTPEFPMGSLVGGGGQTQTTTTGNFQMWAGLPTCTQLGQNPRSVGVTDYDCLVYVTFNPTAPGVRESQLVVKTANNLTYNIALYGIGTGAQLSIDGGTAVTIAAGLKAPAAVAVSSAGTMYIADPGNNRIVVQPSGGAQTSLTFTGVTPATLSGPMGVALDAANNIYISDTGNNRILKVNGTTNVATVLGNYVWVPGSTCYGASAAPDCPTTTPSTVQATTAPPQYAFNAPQGLAVDAWNNVYVADTGNKKVVEIPSKLNLGGAIPLLSYSGAPAFTKPVAVAVDSQGNIYVADSGIAGGLIVELPPGGGDLVTLPGNTFPTVLNSVNANLSSPNGVAVDAAGNVYVSDNVTNTVTEVPLGTGPGSAPFTLNFPSVSSPSGLALDPNGNLYVVDTGNNQVLLDNRQSPTVNFGTVPQLVTSGVANSPNPCPVSGVATPCTGVLTLTNTGTVPVTLSANLFPVQGTANPAFSIPNPGTACANPLPSGLSCQVSPTFAPTSNGVQSESVSVNGGSQTITLQGTGEAPLGPTVLTASYSTGATPTAGATATVTATVTSQIKGNTPTGTVSFSYLIQGDGIKGTASGTLNSSGVTSFTLPTLLQGRRYTVNAVYSGDSVNSSTNSNTLVIYVPGVPVSVIASPVTFVYGQTPPKITGTVTGIVDAAVTYTFTSAANACTPIGTYPITVVFSGGSYLNYGFPPAVTSTGAPALVTETAAPLSYTLPNFTAQYGAPNLSYGAGVSPVGAVCGDFFGATFTPAQSSILNVGTYTVKPTLAPASKAGNYTVTAPPSTLTVTQAPVAISVSAAKTSVLNTASGVAAATYQISVGTAVSQGRGTPTGSVTVSDVFTPITATGYGTPAAPATYTVPLVAGYGVYTPTSTANGLHQYSFTYSGDSNFQTASLAPSATQAPCTLAAIAANCLVVDNPDFTLTSLTSVVLINPGTVPSGNGLPTAPNQSTAYPESAVLFVNTVLGFTGSISLGCTTQNPSYVTCFMTPTTVCFAAASSPACTNTATSAATVVAIETPATLPLGFFGQTRTSPTKTMLAFLPFGVLAFCVRRRRRLSKALWMLIAIIGVGAAMTGCGGNQVAFYTPVPTGAQTVTVTATYLGNGSNQPAETRSFAVPIAIE